MKRPLLPVLRNIYAANLFEYFVVSAAASILIIRAYLEITNYPQVGSGEFHIAHMLWGGLLLTLAFFLQIAFLSNHVKKLTAIIAGVGFGAFIDELGKFITADNNYFYQPTIALIYVIFVIFFLLFRLLSRYSKYSDEEYAANALETMEDMIINDFDIQEKTLAASFLSHANPKNPLVSALQKVLITVETIQSPPPSWFTKWKRAVEKNLSKYLHNTGLVSAFITFIFLNSIVDIIFGIIRLQSNTSFSYSGVVASATVGSMITVYAAWKWILKQRVVALRLFKYSLLVAILITQFFLFLAEQLPAILQLVINLVNLSIVNYLLEKGHKQWLPQHSK